MEKLSTQYNLHWSLLRWVATFLQGRAQVTRVGALVSAPLYLNGGIPQGPNWVLCCLLLWSMTLFKVGAPALNSWMV